MKREVRGQEKINTKYKFVYFNLHPVKFTAHTHTGILTTQSGKKKKVMQFKKKAKDLNKYFTKEYV